MKRGRKIVMVVCMVTIALPTCLVAMARVHNFYAKWQAKRLLKVLRTMQPGTTSEEEYVVALKPFQGHFESVYEGDNSSKIVALENSIAIRNNPSCEPTNNDCMLLEERFLPLILMLEGRVVAEDTDFSVIPTFLDGKLAELTFEEIQIHPLHCCSARVTRHTGFWQGREFAPTPFNGYSIGYADSQVWNVDVDLDQRATPEQLEKVLDFSFSCFTALRSCEEAKDFLQPVGAISK